MGNGAAAARSPAERRWSVLTILCGSMLVIAIDMTVLHIAVPALTADLRPSAVQLLWIVDIYPLVVAPLLVPCGTLGDRYGRRRFLVTGYVLYALASAWAAFAPSAEQLISARAAFGLGEALIMPATLSIIREAFPDPRERALAIGVWSATAGAGAAIGPVLGGVLVDSFWWGSVFLINVPIMGLAIPIALRVVPESRHPQPVPWDVHGALLATAGVFALAFGAKQMGRYGVDAYVVLAMPAGIAALAMFTIRQLRRPHPLLDVRVFAQRPFTVAVGCVLLAVFALVSLMLLLAQYLQLVLGMSATSAGLWLLPLTFAAVGGSVLAAPLLNRLGARAVMCGGLALTAGSLTPLLPLGSSPPGWPLILSFAGIGAGVQAALVAGSSVIMASFPAERAGGAAGIEETSYALGSGLGIAVLGSLMNAVYGASLGRPPGVPAAAVQGARESLGEAVRIARDLSGTDASRLLHHAREAYLAGLHTTFIASALLLGAASAIAAIWYPRAWPRT